MYVTPLEQRARLKRGAPPREFTGNFEFTVLFFFKLLNIDGCTKCFSIICSSPILVYF